MDYLGPFLLIWIYFTFSNTLRRKNRKKFEEQIEKSFSELEVLISDYFDRKLIVLLLCFFNILFFAMNLLGIIIFVEYHNIIPSQYIYYCLLTIIVGRFLYNVYETIQYTTAIFKETDATAYIVRKEKNISDTMYTIILYGKYCTCAAAVITFLSYLSK